MITGSSGMGAATARAAAREGARVFIASLRQDECRQLAEELAGGWHSGDLSHEGTATAAVRGCIDRFGRIDALFNVAGISARKFGDGPLHECATEGWDAAMTANARSLFLVSREVLRDMLARGTSGSIVNMGSVSTLSPEPLNFATHAYAASKGAIHSLTIAAAAYYAPHGIRINALAPGLVATPMSLRAQSDQAILTAMRSKQPLAGGMLSAEDVASAAMFLMSDESRMITGEILAVDGGWKLRS